MALLPTAELATAFGLSEGELFRQAFISLLQEKKRQVLRLKLEYLARLRVCPDCDIVDRSTILQAPH